jgi:CCR4-NOT transcription complex subunit 3
MLEQGFCNILKANDRVKSSILLALAPFQGHPSYPKKPMCDNTLFKKFDLDTLFFIFYHQQGTFQQFLAAKELKAKGWIYHKKFQTWFQRSGDPKLTAQDREKGTFLYFDFETAWQQRRKADFEFDYSYLENDLL